MLGTKKVVDLWEKLWKEKVPPKVKITCWRLCKNIGPTKHNLATKHITTDLSCVLDLSCMLYRSASESISHLLKNFHFARCAWLYSLWGLCLVAITLTLTSTGSRTWPFLIP